MEKSKKVLKAADQPASLKGKAMTVIIELEGGKILSLVSPAFFQAGEQINIARIGFTEPYEIPGNPVFKDVELGPTEVKK